MRLGSRYNLWVIGWMLGFILCLPTTYAESEKAEKKKVAWLFVITSKNGEIQANQQGLYRLTLKHTHIEQVMMFSDRPDRIVKVISPEKFLALWDNGEHSFEKDPPNAVAVFGENQIAMELIGMKIQKDRTIFLVKNDDDKIPEMVLGEVALFVDDEVGELTPIIGIYNVEKDL